MKLAIFIMSDPKAGEESFGRAFNGLATASEAQSAGDDVAVVFAGAGTRWPEELAKLDNPAHGLYESVRESVQGASCGCADAFGATESLEACNVPLIKDHALAGTSGVASPRRFVEQGYETLVF